MVIEGASDWTLSGTMSTGQRIEVRGGQLRTLLEVEIVKKDSFWKVRTAE